MSDYTPLNRPNVSVVIAVFNVENYIAQCCHSLFSQTLDNIEYLFVNDCSPDKSIEVVKSVLEEYPHRKRQVKILEHTVNLGVSRTREDGVKAATGDFIIHCDPDDWVESDMYKSMYEKAIENNADMVICDVYFHYPSSSKTYYAKETRDTSSSREILANCLHAQTPILHCYLWNKLIRAPYYKTVTWHSGISLYEDVITCSQIMQTQLKVSCIGQAFYYYRQREESLLHRRFTQKNIENDYKVVSILHHYLCESGDPELIYYWQAFVPWLMAFSIHSTDPIYTNKEYLERYRKYRSCILKDRGLSKSARYYLYSTTFNYIIPFTLLQWYRRIGRLLKNK